MQELLARRPVDRHSAAADHYCQQISQGFYRSRDPTAQGIMYAWQQPSKSMLPNFCFFLGKRPASGH